MKRDMDTIKAIIIDDEEDGRDVLSNLIVRTNRNIEILSTCDSLVSGVEQIKLLKPDVVFLDVQMPNYAGYEIGSFFDSIDFEIIFVTAFDQYAIKAFELSAIDYLVKPVNRLRLNESLDKLVKKLGSEKISNEYKLLLENMKSENSPKLVISEMSGKRILDMSKIIAIQGKGAYSEIILSSGEKILASKNLSHFESVLPKESFFRTHKSWIVGINQIVKLIKGRGVVELNHGVFAKLSKYRIEEFERIFST